MVTEVSSQLNMSLAVNRVFFKTDCKLEKNSCTLCLLRLVARPKLVASGSLSESSGFRAQNPANQSIPASLESIQLSGTVLLFAMA